MGKQKTKKAVSKRFKMTKTGKILHRSHGARHLKSNKSQKQLRHLRQMKEVKSIFKAKIKKLLGK
jgi:large subunit ribosomal protein L35